MAPLARSWHDDRVSSVAAAPVRVACVDDDTVIREGLPHLLEGCEVVCALKSAEQLLDRRPDVDVVLLDLRLAGTSPQAPALQGVRAVRAVAAAGYRVLIYTNESRKEVLAACLGAGASGVVHKAEPMSVLAAAVRRVLDGEVVVTTALVGLAEYLLRQEEVPRLSPRQLEVLRARARGESFKSIGSRMYLSPKTVEEYMGEVNRKFAAYLRDHSPADLERLLGVGADDLVNET